jgi:hypothetical protein
MDQVLVSRAVERRRKRRRGLIVLLAALAIGSLGAGAMSLAIFTDSDATTWSFTTGSIDISVAPKPVTAAVTGMMPGDAVTAPLTVTNAGSADLRYAMTTVATNPLGQQLDLEVRTEDVDGACDDFDGASVVAAGTQLDGAAIGDPAPQVQSNERTLAAGNAEVLCFRVSLPLSTGIGFMGATSTATFTFDAEQTANNP